MDTFFTSDNIFSFNCNAFNSISLYINLFSCSRRFKVARPADTATGLPDKVPA